MAAVVIYMSGQRLSLGRANVTLNQRAAGSSPAAPANYIKWVDGCRPSNVIP